MLDSLNADSKSGHVIIAGCESEAEAMAAMRWLWPVLFRPGQHDPVMLVCDARDCDAARAAPITNPDAAPRWGVFDTASFDHAEPVCHVIGGRYGLIVLADEAQAGAAIRALSGLITQVVLIPPGDPLMLPFSRSLAAFGLAPRP